MGIMECSRTGCDEIMCEKIHTFGNYICNRCMRDFKKLMKKSGFENATREFYDQKFSEFLDTFPKEKKEISINDYF